MKARIFGVETLMHSFDFLVGVFLGELVLRHNDNLFILKISLLQTPGKLTIMHNSFQYIQN